MKVEKRSVEEDAWIPSVCGMCYGGCAIMVHRVDGTVVKIEGNPHTSQGYGRICGKGVAGLQNLYDPNRVNVPLKRTNPEKGRGVDPNWKEISWDEAMDILVEKLGRIIREAVEPRGLEVAWEQYTPMPDWFPCPPHREESDTHDLYAFSYRDIIHTGTWTMQLPYIDEASRMNPYTYNITMNADTAREKGLGEGDMVWVENNRGRKIKGRLKTMQGIHPRCMGIAACVKACQLHPKFGTEPCIYYVR